MMVLGAHVKKLANGFTWLPIHWSHDPEKTPEWALAMRSKFPRPIDWDKEMEIDFGLHVGTPAYPRYSDVKHLGPTIYDPRRPIALMMDFNTNPMSLIVSQIHEHLKQIHVLKSFVYGPTTIDDVIDDFRKHYNEHASDIAIYGDATSGTNAQTARSNWDVVRLAFRGYHIVPKILVPAANPLIGNRLNAVNRLLQGESQYIVIIDDGGENEELIRDLREVILTPDGKKIYKTNDQDDPYYFRTHASDAFGYWVYFEWPVVKEMFSAGAKKRAPLEYGRLLGEVDQGPKWREEQKRVEQGKKKRRPLDRGGAV